MRQDVNISLFGLASLTRRSFSRKDALRRHWLVKGCRGEEGATAQISEVEMLPVEPSKLTFLL